MITKTHTILALDLKIADTIEINGVEHIVSDARLDAKTSFVHVITLGGGSFYLYKNRKVNLLRVDIEAFRGQFIFDKPEYDSLEGWETEEERGMAYEANESIYQAYVSLLPLFSDLYLLDKRNDTETIAELQTYGEDCAIEINEAFEVFAISAGYLVQLGNTQLVCKTSQEIYMIAKSAKEAILWERQKHNLAA